MSGFVSFVSAGPGDPELITVKALRLLRTADVVLHDDLVSPEILKLISPAAEVQNVGKRCGSKAIRQEEASHAARVLGASIEFADAGDYPLRESDELIDLMAVRDDPSGHRS